MTIKSLIIQYLKNKGTWEFGGVIDDYLREVKGTKGGTTERRLRELTDHEGIIEKEYKLCGGVKCVMYKYKSPPPKTEEQKEKERLQILMESLK